MKSARVSLYRLNTLDEASFVEVCGPFFEHSPWIAIRTWSRRPFSSVENLHDEFVATVRAATSPEQVALIVAHPDLVGRLAREGQLTHESTTEQAAAGLNALSPDEVTLFNRFNADYRAAFGFPFVICARENRKDAILVAFPTRLKHSREQEIACALDEIYKIARHRLLDRIKPD